MGRRIRKFVKRNMRFILPAALTTAGLLQVDYETNKESIISLPVPIVSELRNNDYINEKHNFEIDGELNNNDITDKKLAEVKELDFSVVGDFDLDFLKYCKNLEKITISNAELLTQYDIDAINDSNVQNVSLKFDLDNVDMMRENKFDLSRIKKKTTIKNKLYDSTECKNVILLNYLKNYNENSFEDVETYKQNEKLDDELDAMISDMNIDPNLRDEEKILIVANYLCKGLEYDKIVDKVYNNLDSYNFTDDDIIKANELVTAYNAHPISTVIDQRTLVKNAICINYAELVDLLCYKLNIKTRVVTGYDGSASHAWNVAYLNGDKCFVDITSYELYGDVGTLNQYVISGQNRSNPYYDYLTSCVFLDRNLNFKTYKLNTDVEDLDKKVEKYNVKFYNKANEGKSFIGKPIDYEKPIAIGAGVGLLSLLIGEIKDHRNRKKRGF